MTGQEKRKLEIITQLTASFNQGNSSVNKSYTERVDYALRQYDRMVELGIIKEENKKEE